jgi:hypothetical protein
VYFIAFVAFTQTELSPGCDIGASSRRHGMLHETNRRDVIPNLLVWISGVLKKSS